MPARRFPPPWSIEELNDACFVVRDHDGHNLPMSTSRMSRPNSSWPKQTTLWPKLTSEENNFGIFQQRWRGRL